MPKAKGEQTTLRGITDEEWAELWKEFEADVNTIPQELWRLIPQKLSGEGDVDRQMEEAVEHFAGEPTMLPDDALMLLAHYEKIILTYFLLMKYTNRVPPHPTLAITMELIGRVMNEMQGILRREFKGKPEEERLEWIM